MAARRASVVLELYAPADVRIRKALGGGILKERVLRERASGRVIEYALAYINHDIFAGDHGRVLGYDNSHGVSHRHFLGRRTDEPFAGYEALFERFQSEWMALAIAHVNKGK